MPYSAPPVWEHGDVPTAALMNKYSDGLNTIYTALQAKKHLPAAKVRQYASATADTHFQDVTDDNSYCVLTHLHRWLFYAGAGNIQNLAQTETTTLPDTGGGGGATNIFDLDSVNWLVYGGVYRINSITWAFEDWEP